MKSSVLYFCLTVAVIFFAVRVFADNAGFYDQITDLYANSQKIPDIKKARGIWLGKCYPRVSTPDQHTEVLDVEGFLEHWRWDPPPGSPLKPIEADKFQIRPKTGDSDTDWVDFLSQAGNLGSLAEYSDEHVSPNTWGPYFSHPEWQSSTEADIRSDGKFMYVWMRAQTDQHWACYLAFDHAP